MGHSFEVSDLLQIKKTKKFWFVGIWDWSSKL